MKSIEARQHEMLVRVRDFGATYGYRFPESSVARESFANVTAAVQALGENAVSKMSTARAGAGTRAATRQALRAQLEAMTRTAREIGAGTPGLEDKFRIPRKPNDPVLLTTGRLFVRDAEAWQAQFVAHAMPEAFLADLAQAVDAFERAVRGRDTERSRNTAARANIEAALAAGLAEVRKLDVIVANALRDDPVTLAVWKRDKRVGYPSRSKTAAPPKPAPEATPASRPATSSDNGTLKAVA